MAHVVKPKPSCRHCGAMLPSSVARCPRCGKRSVSQLFLGLLGRRY